MLNPGLRKISSNLFSWSLLIPNKTNFTFSLLLEHCSKEIDESSDGETIKVPFTHLRNQAQFEQSIQEIVSFVSFKRGYKITRVFCQSILLRLEAPPDGLAVIEDWVTCFESMLFRALIWAESRSMATSPRAQDHRTSFAHPFNQT